MVIAILILASPVTTAMRKYGIAIAIDRTTKRSMIVRRFVSAPKRATVPRIAGPEQGAARREYPSPTT
jgi:hypothetical protein